MNRRATPDAPAWPSPCPLGCGRAGADLHSKVCGFSSPTAPKVRGPTKQVHATASSCCFGLKHRLLDTGVGGRGPCHVALTGIRVPLDTHAPLRFPGTLLTAEHCGKRTAPLGFVPADLFCIALDVDHLLSWRKFPIDNGRLSR